MAQRIVLLLQRHQPALHVVLDVDAFVTFLTFEALFVKQLEGRGFTGEHDGRQLLHLTSCPRPRSRVKLQDKPSPGPLTLHLLQCCRQVYADAFSVVVILGKESPSSPRS